MGDYKMCGKMNLINRAFANMDREYNRTYYRDPKPYEPAQSAPINITIKVEQPQRSAPVIQPTVTTSERDNADGSLMRILRLCSDFINK